MQNGRRGVEARMNNNVGKGNKICGRLCVELTGHLASPLSVGSGEQGETDADVIVDAGNNPFIPGSGIAGALLAYNRELGLEKESVQLFGAPYDGNPGTDSDRQSRIYCYDVFLESWENGIRDGVKLGKNKTPQSGSKYEIQIVERNAGFRMRIEIIQRKDFLDSKGDIQKAWASDKFWIQQWIYGFSTGELRIGGRSRRGLGRLEIESAKVKTFNMEQKDEYLEWLNWDWNNKNAFEQAEIIEAKNIGDKKEVQHTEHFLEVSLKISNTLLVRTYNMTFGKGGGIPDYGQLTMGSKGEVAVIPGSTIAGAFRSHIAKIVKRLSHLQTWEEAQKKLEPFFGTWIEGGRKEENLISSRIIFEEAEVNGGHGVPLSRIAIDRFTGGTVEGALFEEVPWADGTVSLRIRWKKGKNEESNKVNSSNVICGLLLWAILDLLSGILPIGGETAIGRGILSEAEQLKSKIFLDGNVLNESMKRECMQAAAAWCTGRE